MSQLQIYRYNHLLAILIMLMMELNLTIIVGSILYGGSVLFNYNFNNISMHN